MESILIQPKFSFFAIFAAFQNFKHLSCVHCKTAAYFTRNCNVLAIGYQEIPFKATNVTCAMGSRFPTVDQGLLI